MPVGPHERWQENGSLAKVRERTCGGFSNIYQRVAVFETPRGRIQQDDARLSATRSKVHVFPPLIANPRAASVVKLVITAIPEVDVTLWQKPIATPGLHRPSPSRAGPDLPGPTPRRVQKLCRCQITPVHVAPGPRPAQMSRASSRLKH